MARYVSKITGKGSRDFTKRGFEEVDYDIYVAFLKSKGLKISVSTIGEVVEGYDDEAGDAVFSIRALPQGGDDEETYWIMTRPDEVIKRIKKKGNRLLGMADYVDRKYTITPKSQSTL